VIGPEPVRATDRGGLTVADTRSAAVRVDWRSRSV
jgi:hypothetical protein